MQENAESSNQFNIPAVLVFLTAAVIVGIDTNRSCLQLQTFYVTHMK